MPHMTTSRGQRPAKMPQQPTSRVRLVGIRTLAMALALGTAGVMAGAPLAPDQAQALAAGAVPTCLASQLSARVMDWQGAAGSRIADVTLVNTSFIHCSLRDLPRVQLISAHGTVLINGAAASTTAHTHGLNPLGFLKTEISDSNYCGQPFAAPVTLAFVLPGAGGRLIAIPVSPTDAAGVPPCNGAPGSLGHISMHAWHH